MQCDTSIEGQCTARYNLKNNELLFSAIRVASNVLVLPAPFSDGGITSSAAVAVKLGSADVNIRTISRGILQYLIVHGWLEWKLTPRGC